jgi:hypothetical protein
MPSARGRSSFSLDARMRRYLILSPKLFLVAAVGFVLVYPWAIAWSVLSDSVVVPIFKRHFACCTPDNSAAEAYLFRLWDILACSLAAVVAFVTSVALGLLPRLGRFAPWIVFCVAAYLGVHSVMHVVLSSFLLSRQPLLIFAIASAAGFWTANWLQRYRSASNQRLERP